MRSNLNYKEVLNLQYEGLSLDKFIKFIESVPFEIFVDKNWNPIIYETLEISKEDFESYEDKHKLKTILDATAIMKGNGNWLDGMRLLKDECKKVF